MNIQKEHLCKKRSFTPLLLAMVLVAGLAFSCHSNRNLCPAYGNTYEKERLPY